MRHFLSVLSLAAVLAAGPAAAEDPAKREPITPKTVGELSLDQLFEELP